MITTNTTNTTGATNSATNSAIGANVATKPKSTSKLSESLDTQTLSQKDFLRLLVTQVKNQDPTKPMDSTQFVSQLAQFSSLAGVTELNGTMQGVADHLQSSQLMQGASLVGHQVLAPGSAGELSDSAPLMGAVNVPISTSSVVVKVHDAAGTLVQSVDLGEQPAGMLPFSWDGTRSDGQQAAKGIYYVDASYLENNKPIGAETLMAARVNSVSRDSSGLLLDIQNLGSMGLDQVSMLM